MKAFCTFLFSTICLLGYSSSLVQEINQRALELIENNQSEAEDEELLFEFYTNEIAALDPSVVIENPELVYRKAMAWLEVLDYSPSLEILIDGFRNVKKEFEFVLEHEASDTRLFKAASTHLDFLNEVLQASPKEEEAFFSTYFGYNNRVLRQWAINPSLEGKDLREDVLLNIERDTQVKDAFYQWVMLGEEPDIALGYINPSEFEVMGVFDLENGQSILLYQTTYDKGNCHTVIQKGL